MIDFDKLDKEQTYICLEYGQGKISEVIKKYSREYCYNREEVPSHVFALCYDKQCKQWLIYESHMVGSRMGCLASGTRRYYKPILEKVFPQVIIHSNVYPASLEEEKLQEYLCQPYGIGDIFALLNASKKHNLGKKKDRYGYICSEYIALAFPNICAYFNLPAHCITPAHFLKYFFDQDIEPIS